jgi:hypothetical protein
VTKKQLDILQAARAWREQDRALEVECRLEIPGGLTLSDRHAAADAQQSKILAIQHKRSEALAALSRAVDASDSASDGAVDNSDVPKST